MSIIIAKFLIIINYCNNKKKTCILNLACPMSHRKQSSRRPYVLRTGSVRKRVEVICEERVGAVTSHTKTHQAYLASENKKILPSLRYKQIVSL